MKPIVSFVTFYRAHYNAYNLTALLNTKDDFDLYIIDNNSNDGTWEFIQSLEDDRIKCKKRFDKNRGIVYAMNYVLSKRKKDQYFMHFDSDTIINKDNWTKIFIDTIEEFKDIGMLSATSDRVIIQYKDMLKPVSKSGFNIYEGMSFGSCHCLSPRLLDIIGYWNEENYRIDEDMRWRIMQTDFKLAVTDDFKIEFYPKIHCDNCQLKSVCEIKRKPLNDRQKRSNQQPCYQIYQGKYIHTKEEWRNITGHKFKIYKEQIENGERSLYCASIHDPESIKSHYYNQEWAEENFNYFIDNAN